MLHKLYKEINKVVSNKVKCNQYYMWVIVCRLTQYNIQVKSLTSAHTAPEHLQAVATTTPTRKGCIQGRGQAV
jgi:hypothetical protein